MIHAVFGNIVGSRFQMEPHRSEFFETLTPENSFLGETVNIFATITCFNMYYSKQERNKFLIRNRYNSICLAYIHKNYDNEFLDSLLQDSPELKFNTHNLVQFLSLFFYCNQKNIDFLEIKNFFVLFGWTHPLLYEIDALLKMFLDLEKYKFNKPLIKSILNENNIDILDLDSLRTEGKYIYEYKRNILAAITILFSSRDYIDSLHKAVSIGGNTPMSTTIVGFLSCLIFPISNEEKILMLNNISRYFSLYDKEIYELLKFDCGT